MSLYTFIVMHKHAAVNSLYCSEQNKFHTTHHISSFLVLKDNFFFLSSL